MEQTAGSVRLVDPCPLDVATAERIVEHKRAPRFSLAAVLVSFLVGCSSTEAGPTHELTPVATGGSAGQGGAGDEGSVSGIGGQAGSPVSACSGPCPAACSQGACTTVEQVWASGAMSCARLADGAFVCWGDRSLGPLLSNVDQAAPIPTPVAGLEAFAQLALGGKHLCGVRQDGTVACWGDNVYGQLGTDIYPSNPSPLTVPGLTGIAEVATGFQHTCARRLDGTVICWGANLFRKEPPGPDGDPTFHKPTEIPGLTGAVQLAAGGSHTCARRADATVHCWGSNFAGQFGRDTLLPEPVVVEVEGLSGVTAIAVGSDHSCARLTDATVRCWGGNEAGQLGNGTQAYSSPSPTTVQGLADVAELALGLHGSCARRMDGLLLCWGRNDHGQQGDGTQTTSLSEQLTLPKLVPNLSGVAQIAYGIWHLCARLTDGSARCWGHNACGQIGDGTFLDRLSPTPVEW